MSDPQRTDPPGAPDSQASVDARTEELLLLGLDHYFGGEYERAMHVWTRVLFLDRGHARARAYIERARGALAERHRENEELVHEGVAAFDRGDVETARRLLTTAVERGGAREDAVAVLDRLERLSGVSSPAARSVPGVASRGSGAVRSWASTWKRLPWLLVLMAGALVVTGLIGADQLRTLLPAGSISPPAPVPAAPDEPLQVPTLSDVTLSRAWVLFERGHLRESLRALDDLPPGDVLRGEADELRSAIQRALLTGIDPRSIARPRAEPLRGRR
jgi:hypothetical protein